MSRQTTGTVYLLHFDRPYKHARHYLGFTTALDERIESHRAGAGARLMAVVKAAGIGFTLARTWPGKTRSFERKLKSGAHVPRYCPACRTAARGSNSATKD